LSKLTYDESRGELRIKGGQRQAAIDVTRLCQHFDTLVGLKVAETIMDSHERRLGREDAERIRSMNPSGKVEDMVRALIEEERSVGLGVAQIRLPESPAEPTKFEVINPIMNADAGAGKGLVLSYWSAALSLFLGRELEATNVHYDSVENTLVADFKNKQ
jgi:hypothetical protein